MQKAFGYPEAAVQRRLRAMRRRCPEWEVSAAPGALGRVPAKVDAKDRHVAAASLTLRQYVEEEPDQSECDVYLVTDNVRHFAKGDMGKLGVKVVKAGTFLDTVYLAHPAETERAVQTAVSDLKDPPYTRAELLAALNGHGAHQLVEGLSARWKVAPTKRVAANVRGGKA